MKAHLDAVGVIDLTTGLLFAAPGVLASAGVLLAAWFYSAPLWKPADEAIVLAVALSVSGAAIIAQGFPTRLGSR